MRAQSGGSVLNPGVESHLSGKHLVAVRAGDALDPAVLGLPHVDVPDVGAQVGLGAEYPDTQVAPLVHRAPAHWPSLGAGAHFSS